MKFETRPKDFFVCNVFCLGGTSVCGMAEGPLTVLIVCDVLCGEGTDCCCVM